MKDRALSLGPRLRRRIGSRRRPTLAPRRLLSIRFREGVFFCLLVTLMLSEGSEDIESLYSGRWTSGISKWREVLEKWEKVRVECSHFTLVRFDRTEWLIILRRDVMSISDFVVSCDMFIMLWEFGAELRNFDIYRKLTCPQENGGRTNPRFLRWI